MKNYSNSELLTELETRLANNLFTTQEIRNLSRILAANYAQISQALTQALSQARLKQQSLLNSLTPTEREQVNEFLAKHGFKTN
jgi:hypothetical protein